jgi:hypothetical protein
MKKIILLIILLAFLTSCGMIQQSKDQIKIPEVHSGTQGVVLEFMEGMPPNEVYEERHFEIMLKVYNKGASDIKGGMLKMSTEAQQVSIEGENDQRFDLEGKSVFNPEGGQTRKSFRAQASPLIAQIESYSTPITATACYPYQTEATALMCIDTDIAGMVKNKPCKPTTKVMTGGQGGPVAITSVEPKMTTHEEPQKIRPEFLIKLQNLGTGQAMRSLKVYDACTGRPLGSENWNVVELSAEMSDTPLTCRPETIKISADTTVICSFDKGIEKNRGTYTAPLSIKLNYGYMDRIVKNIQVKKLVPT